MCDALPVEWRGPRGKTGAAEGRRLVGRIAAAALLAPAMGCALIAGLSDRGLAGSAEGGAEAAADTGAPDGTLGAMDSTAEAGDSGARDGTLGDQDADAFAGTYCTRLSPTPTFCADFDEPDASPGTGWNRGVSEAGSVVLTTDAWVSPPRSLLSTNLEGGTTGVKQAFSGVSSFQIDFDFWFAELPDAGVTSPLKINVPTVAEDQFVFYASTASAYFQEGGGSADMSNKEEPGPATNQWHHLSVTLMPQGEDASVVNADFDDGGLTWTDHTLKYQWPPDAGVTLWVGVADQYQVSSSQTIAIDNVVVRVNP